MPVQIDYEQLTKITQQDLDEGVWDAEHKVCDILVLKQIKNKYRWQYGIDINKYRHKELG